MRRCASPQSKTIGYKLPILITGVALSLSVAWMILTSFGHESQLANESRRASAKEAPEPSRKTERTQQEKAPGSRSGRHVGQAGQKVYVDPRTGRLTGPPDDARSAEEAAREFALSTSDVGLVEKPLPGGGSIVDVQGRFRSPMVATISSDGKLTIDHPPVKPVPDANRLR